jgi:hypothetical protein
MREKFEHNLNFGFAYAKIWVFLEFIRNIR